MLELSLNRRYKKSLYTIGKLSVAGVYFCDTLEDRDRGLTQSMSSIEIYKKKIYGLTAIPTGRYRVLMDVVSPKFRNKVWAKPYGGKIPRLEGVPGFDGILIHPLNTASESYGCIGVGENRVVAKILDSQYWFKKLMDEVLLPAHKRGEEIWITIY